MACAPSGKYDLDLCVLHTMCCLQGKQLFSFYTKQKGSDDHTAVQRNLHKARIELAIISTRQCTLSLPSAESVCSIQNYHSRRLKRNTKLQYQTKVTTGVRECLLTPPLPLPRNTTPSKKTTRNRYDPIITFSRLQFTEGFFFLQSFNIFHEKSARRKSSILLSTFENPVIQ